METYKHFDTKKLELVSVTVVAEFECDYDLYSQMVLGKETEPYVVLRNTETGELYDVSKLTFEKEQGEY